MQFHFFRYFQGSILLFIFVTAMILNGAKGHIVQCADLLSGSDLSQGNGLYDRIEELLNHSWVDKRFSAPFLKALNPLSDRNLESEFAIDAKILHDTANSFSHQRSGMQPMNIRHILAGRPIAGGHQVVVLFILKLDKEVVGFLALSMNRMKNRSLEA